MRSIPLGTSGIASSALGLGCMGMSEFYGPRDDDSSMKTLERAFELGITMFDTSDLYGRGHNELLLGRFIKGRRDRVLVCTKFGIKRDPFGAEGSTQDRDLDNSPAYVRQACEASLKRLGTDYIDLYYVHRYSAAVPIEDLTGALADLVKEGKVRAIGYSEIGAELLRRAHSIHPIAALQSEYSLWAREVETQALPACRELGVTLVAYSPLGRGFLTGAVQDPHALAANDVRLTSGRFSGDNFGRNLRLVEQVKAIAAARGFTAGQVALAWLFARGDDIIPIPGTKRVKYLEENAAALDIRVSEEELATIGEIISPATVAGSRETASQTAAREAGAAPK